MKYTMIALTMVWVNISLVGQATTDNMIRTIEVTGMSERSVEPDKIIFTISIEEYWKEEFEGKKYEDYKTKIEIEGIEQSLVSELKALGIGMEQITLKQAGNGWRQRGKDFLVSKTIDVVLESFAKANELSNTIKTRGVRNMTVSKLINDNIETIKLEVKAEAIKAAKSKAVLLAAALDKKIKDVITIVEIDQYANAIPRPQPMAYARAASMDAEAGGVAYENFKKLETKAVVRCVFEME